MCIKIHIEDVSPDILRGSYEGHLYREFTPDDSGEIKTFDPGAITIGGAVVISFKIKYES